MADRVKLSHIPPVIMAISILSLCCKKWLKSLKNHLVKMNVAPQVKLVKQKVIGEGIHPG
ncbi:MAG: hypothetical protein RLZZ490_625 [Cyanobacteriota bacterium]